MFQKRYHKPSQGITCAEKAAGLNLPKRSPRGTKKISAPRIVPSDPGDFERRGKNDIVDFRVLGLKLPLALIDKAVQAC
jgi:hypothetical protein